MGISKLLKKSLVIMLAAVIALSGGLTQLPAYAADQPNKINDKYVINDVTYYDAKSKHFKDSEKQFYMDLLNAPITQDKAPQGVNVYDRPLSLAEEWLALAAPISKSFADVYKTNSDPCWTGNLRDVVVSGKVNEKVVNPGTSYYAFYEPLTYTSKGGKDAFYIRGSYNGNWCYVVFRDFSVVAIMPDANTKGNYVSTTIDNSKMADPVVSEVLNEGGTPSQQNVADTESGTVTMSSSVSGSEQYSFSESIKAGFEAGFLSNKVSTEISFSATQAFQEGWSESKTESKTYSKTTNHSRTIPPYAAAVMETGTTDIEMTSVYNCPVGVKYTVDILVGGTKEWDGKNWDGKKITFGSDARKDLYQRAYIDGLNKDSRYSNDNGLDPDGIPWNDVNGIWSDNDGYHQIFMLSHAVPMSSTGAVLKETQKSTLATFKEFVPIYPLDIIKIEAPTDGTAISSTISYENYDYLHMTMPVGKSSYTKYFNLKGYNKYRGEYCLFNKDFGHWIVVDAAGNDLGNNGPVVLDKVGTNTRFTAVKAGTCYLKYLIDEDAYTSVETGDAFIKNKDINTAMMEITVTEPELVRSLEITGRYTGYVNADPEDINDKLQGAVLDETGAEVDEPFIWKAKQLPSKGINLTEDGMISFKRAGTYQVRIMTPDNKHYSEWYDITAEWLGDDEDLPDINDDAKYRTAGADTVLFVDGSFDGSANGETVNLEGEGKLTVSAEDLSDQILPIRYEWEQLGNNGNGLNLSKNGTAVFTQPGSYYVRVGSGDVYSNWVEITAKDPATVKTAPVANNRIYDGEARALVEPGVAVDGEMAYVVEKDSVSVPPEDAYYEDSALDIPTATEKGTYYVWYRAIGDERHGSSAAKRLKVVIADKEEQEAAISQTKSAKATLNSVTAKKGKKAVVKWKKNSSADGYQLLYSTSKKFTKKTTKSVTVKKASTVKKTVKKLKKGKKYYFKVRSYKSLLDPATESYKIFYGKWSKVKSIKVK